MNTVLISSPFESLFEAPITVQKAIIIDIMGGNCGMRTRSLTDQIKKGNLDKELREVMIGVWFSVLKSDGMVISYKNNIDTRQLLSWSDDYTRAKFHAAERQFVVMGAVMSSLENLRLGVINLYTFLEQCGWKGPHESLCLNNMDQVVDGLRKKYYKIFDLIDEDESKLQHGRFDYENRRADPLPETDI